ncbi:MAG: hypothetical protein HQM09_05445 [Candidatus Riflebacteria bacterium]|nr:hypothetical protein [Candidatus Riflebacteria bacterium]
MTDKISGSVKSNQSLEVSAYSLRLTLLETSLIEVAKCSLYIFLSVSLLYLISGLIGFQWRMESGVTRLTFIADNPLFARIVKIFVWDIFLWLLALGCMHLKSDKIKAHESLLAFSLCFFLWRIVFSNLEFLIFPFSSAVEVQSLPPVDEMVLFLLPLVIGKRVIFQYLDALDNENDSTLFAFFSWHHRKDAVFNILYGVTVFANSISIPPDRVFFLTVIIKIMLLGSASWNISVRCWNILVRNQIETAMINKEC